MTSPQTSKRFCLKAKHKWNKGSWYSIKHKLLHNPYGKQNRISLWIVN